jgi:hypothetical protein
MGLGEIGDDDSDAAAADLERRADTEVASLRQHRVALPP